MNEVLLAAVYRNSDEEVCAALAAGADPNGMETSGRTALTHAAIDGQLSLVDLLLKSGAREDVADNLAMTSLHYAVQGRHHDVALRLLKAGAGPNAQDRNGNTPVHGVVFNDDGSDGSRQVLRAILDLGGEVRLKNHHGVSPASLAETMGSELFSS